MQKRAEEFDGGLDEKVQKEVSVNIVIADYKKRWSKSHDECGTCFL